MKIQHELKNHFFKNNNQQYSRCLSPGFTCEEPAIRAHSIQNAQVLDLMCRNGHVTMLTQRTNQKTGPEVVFSEIGRNKASTFTGLCSRHDSEIFKEIDTLPFDSKNLEHLFLIAYRSVLKGVHSEIENAGKIQSAYIKRVELGLDSGNRPSEAGMMGVAHMLQAHKLHVYQTKYNLALIRGDFDAISHKFIDISHSSPRIAVSSLFSLGDIRRNKNETLIALNIFPVSTEQTKVIFSYHNSDAHEVSRLLRKIFDNVAIRRNYELSKLVLANCENFVISPNHFDSWTQDVREVIKNYFFKTILQRNLSSTDPRLMLF